MFFLFPLLLVGMLLETLSVGMVIPAIGLLLEPNYLNDYRWIQLVLEFLGNPNEKQRVILGLIALGSVFVLKNTFLFFQVLTQGTFVYGAQREIAVKLFQNYLLRPYGYHLQNNSSFMIRNLTTEINGYCSYVLMPFLNLIGEALVVLALLILLIVIQPIATVCIGICLGLTLLVFFKLTNMKVAKWGEERQDADEAKIRYLQQGFGAIKEIILNGRVDYFVQLFQKPNIISGLMTKREYIFQYVPKQFVEALVIVCLIGFCVLLITLNRTSIEVLTMLGLLATAGFRLIPSFSRILRNLQSIQFGWASVKVLQEQMMMTNQSFQELTEEFTDINFQDRLKFNQISFSYAESNELVLDGIDIEISKGETVGIVGESGVGKSTLNNVLLGLVSPTAGSFEIDGKNLEDGNKKIWQAKIGYVPQEVYLLDESILQNIAFGMPVNQIDEDGLQEVIKITKLDKFVADLPNGLNTMAGEKGVRLSGGQKQRIGIARALFSSPEMLVLDEATSALDLQTEKEILDGIKAYQRKLTTLIITHRKSTLEICDSVYELELGKLKVVNH